MSVKYVCVHVCECAWRARMCVGGQGNVCVECVCMHVCMAGKCMCGVCVCVYGREMCMCVQSMCMYMVGKQRGGLLKILQPTTPSSVALLINNITSYHKQYLLIFIIITDNTYAN